MRVFALAACGCSIACVVSDAMLSLDRHDAASDQPTALRATAMVLVVLGSSPSIFNSPLALVAHRGITLGALVAASALGLQYAREGQRAADVFFSTVSLAVAFVGTTGDPLEDPGNRDVDENRRDGPLLRKTSALFAATVGMYASCREVRRCLRNPSEAVDFVVLLGDGYTARGAAHSPKYAWVTASGHAMAACACFFVVVARGARTASLVVALAMVVQILSAFNQMFVFMEMITIYPSLFGDAVSKTVTDVQAETISNAARTAPVGVTFVSAFGLLLLYRSLLEPIREGDDEGQRLLMQGWMWVATPVASLCASLLAVGWLQNVADEDYRWVELSVFVALALNEFRFLITVEAALFLEGLLFCAYVALARHYYEPLAFHHLTYWVLLSIGVICTLGGLFGSLTRVAKRKATLTWLYDAAISSCASMATALLLGFSLILNLCDGRAFAEFATGVVLSPERLALHQVMLHYVPVLATYPALWSRTQQPDGKRAPSGRVGFFWAFVPVVVTTAYVVVAESGVMGSIDGTAYGMAKTSWSGAVAIPGALLVPWTLVGYAFSYVGTLKDT